VTVVGGILLRAGRRENVECCWGTRGRERRFLYKSGRPLTNGMQLLSVARSAFLPKPYVFPSKYATLDDVGIGCALNFRRPKCRRKHKGRANTQPLCSEA
jgi:hypothetical protein